MAKGGYFIIGYPAGYSKTPCDPDSIIESIQKTGGEVAYILHDKDKKKQHYHFLCMWSKSVPPWDSFVEWMQKYNCFAFDDQHRGRTKEENQYCRRVAVVRDVDSCLRYMLHE